MKKIAIFASGSGTNAQRIIEYFKGHPEISVSMVFCNKPDAIVLERVKKLFVDSMVFSRWEFYETDLVLQKLRDINIDFIVLAGFLWLIPETLLKAYKNKIINIHPALLPKFGGKGMYGIRVHESVIQSGDKESGITIHYVNEKYDEGQIIFQAKCQVEPGDTAESLAGKIHKLEYKAFPGGH
jgi:phosphoribosylglycinamide formyltransferase 1